MLGINFRAVHIHAKNVFRARYARSSLGQFWFVLTNAIFIASVGFVWANVWGVKLIDYFPYIAIGYVLYGHMSAALNESTGALIADARLYLNSYVSSDFTVLSHLHRANIQLIYNSPVIFFVIFWIGVDFYSIPKFIVSMIFIQFWLYPMIGSISLLCVRYRDLVPLFGTIFQILFLVTPVMWRIEALPINYRNYVYINPFASALELTRDVLLSREINDVAYFSMGLWWLFAWALYFLIRRFYRKEMTLWL